MLLSQAVLILDQLTVFLVCSNLDDGEDMRSGPLLLFLHSSAFGRSLVCSFFRSCVLWLLFSDWRLGYDLLAHSCKVAAPILWASYAQVQTLQNITFSLLSSVAHGNCLCQDPSRGWAEGAYRSAPGFASVAFEIVSFFTCACKNRPVSLCWFLSLFRDFLGGISMLYIDNKVSIYVYL